MKPIKTILASAALATISLGLFSCNEKDNTPVDDSLILMFSNKKVEMSAETKAWSNCYVESAANDLVYGDFSFSHSANEAWNSWYGFCPTESTDKDNHPDNWIAHQWGSIAGGGVLRQFPYMLCFWDSYNEQDSADEVENPSLSIKLKPDNGLTYFYPQAVALTNSAYGYYAMKEGTAYNRKFTSKDVFTVVIVGKYRGMETGVVRFNLAEGTKILDTWADCDLTPLGKIDEMYFRMESTDTGEYGINNPTYFCMDLFRVKFEE